ncbi:MAG: PHB depolymerase family esterase [Bdellovibrionota bacterium]
MPIDSGTDKPLRTGELHMVRALNCLILYAALVVSTGPAAAALPAFPYPAPRASSAATKLPKLNANAKGNTTSGVSSGAYMALQVAVSFSAEFRGAGLIAGGPWHCAEGSAATAQDRCMKQTTKIDVQALVTATRAAAAKGKLDDVRNLASARFYVFGSEKDTVVKSPASERLKDYLVSFAPASQVQLETSVPSGHGWPTENFGNACGTMGIPWMNKCGYDTAGTLLKQLYGSMKPRASAVQASSLKTFDQNEFDPNGTATLAPFGYVYVPKVCEGKTRCRVHVALHGCQMNSDFVQDKFAMNSGLNEWAETNEIVVVYPQVKSSGGNPFSCWDWFGYTGADYDTKKGEQVRAIKAMVDRLTSP